MIVSARKLIGAGAAAVLLAGMLAGCGLNSAPTLAKPGLRNAKAGMAVRGDDADTPTAPAAGGGMRPLPKPTPVPDYKDPSGGGGDSGEVGALYRTLRNFGYRQSERHMVDAIEACTHTYPMQWDSYIDTQKHWEWWAASLSPEIRKDHDTYVRDAIRLAQYRFDVQYYVWVSKQTRGTQDPTRSAPPLDFNKEIPVVKAIKGEQGWIVQISPRGTVVDFLQLPEEFLNDYNHVIPIPADLY